MCVRLQSHAGQNASAIPRPSANSALSPEISLGDIEFPLDWPRKRKTSIHNVSIIVFTAILTTFSANLACAGEVTINTIADLQNISSNLSGDYILGSDINASGFDFNPIGDSANPFMGSLNGNGHLINNLTINSSEPNSAVGLFGYIGNGKISDLGLTNVDITATGVNDVVGGIAGAMSCGTSFSCYLAGTANSISSSYVTGSIHSVAMNTGGLVGMNDKNGSISSSNSSVNISSQSQNVGGIVGENDGMISSSHSSGPVNCNGYCYTGGVAGYNGIGTISNSYSSSSVNENYNFSQYYSYAIAGGVAGGNSSLIEKSFSTGDVSFTGTGQFSNSNILTYIGGLVGLNSANPEASIKSSYATGAVSTSITGAFSASTVNEGGLVGANGFGSGSGTISSSYSTGSVSASGTVTNRNIGGLLGATSPGGVFSYTDNAYWDVQTSGQPISSRGTGLTTAQLQSGVLPFGFAPTVWTSSVGQYPTLITNPPPNATPTSPGINLEFPIEQDPTKDKLPVYVLTQAGGLSADKSSGSFCNVAITAQPLDPCHTVDKAFYAVDFTVNPGSGASVKGSDTIVSAAAGTVKLVTAESFSDSKGTYWSPKVAIDNGSLNGGSDLWTIYQEFGRIYYDPNDPSAVNAAYNQAVGLISVHQGQVISTGVPLGSLSGDAHLHFQLGYGCKTGTSSSDPIPHTDLVTGCSTQSVGAPTPTSPSPLSTVTVDRYHMTDFKLDLHGTKCKVLSDTSVTSGCDPSRAQYGSSTDPKLPLTNNGRFSFNVSVGGLGLGTTVPIYFDPVIATGYDFRDVSGPLFSSVILPMIGDGLFDLYTCDASQSDFVFDSVVKAGDSHSFGSSGTSCFRVLGIEASAAINPNDPNAFVTGLTFTGDGPVDFTMTAVVQDVPEPGTAVLVFTGLLIGFWMRVRRTGEEGCARS